jgi:hypothetical protein
VLVVVVVVVVVVVMVVMMMMMMMMMRMMISEERGISLGEVIWWQFLQRSEVQGAIYEGSQKIRFPILLPPNNFT